MKKRALISVSDKCGIVDFAKELVSLGYEIISTGGTKTALDKAGIKTIGISDITGFPECLDGRVKTLHPAVHAGLLAMRGNKEHMSQLEKLGINTIDIVAVNLYPFKQTISKDGVSFAEAIENIDIGGPTMIRAAAKNYQDVAVIVNPEDYETVVNELKANGEVSLQTKKLLSYKVFEHTSVYDTLISTYLREQLGIKYPDKISFAFEKVQDMRYGENPQQSAAFYGNALPNNACLAGAKQLNGKELSFNNINDTNGAIELLREFKKPCAVAVKHTNPCGVAEGKTLLEAYQKAYNCDPVSIFGGIVALNGVVEEDLANELVKIFLEVVVAKGYSDKALQVLKSKPNLRVLVIDDIDQPRKYAEFDMKRVSGGLLVQDKDAMLFESLEDMTNTKATAKQKEDLEFAYKIVKHCKSNAIVIAKDGASVGIGVGQTSRVWAMQQAIEHGGENVKGAAVASDAFFPFRDCVDLCAAAGVKSIIQPGGSIRDQESIDACNENGIAMLFCKNRHFKH